MTDILFVLGIALTLYIFTRVILKEPLLPWKKKKSGTAAPSKTKGKKKKGKKGQTTPDVTPMGELFEDIKEIDNHMIRYHDGRFVMVAEVRPVNYFLLSQYEQEAIDSTFETWMAQINYPVSYYFQNRYVDLKDSIQEIDQTLRQEELNDYAREYGRSMIRQLDEWQRYTPRYETKRYLIFTYDLDAASIKAEDDDEWDDKAIEKAFNELYRRLNTAKNSLRKAQMSVELLTTEGIMETMYYAMNRKKAFKHRFKDLKQHENLAMYVTADQESYHIENVKEAIDRENEVVEKEEATG